MFGLSRLLLFLVTAIFIYSASKGAIAGTTWVIAPRGKCMSLNLSRTILRVFRLVGRLLLVILDSIKKILDLIDDGIANGSCSLPSWYFELIEILNALQSYFDKLDAMAQSDILNKSVEE